MALEGFTIGDAAPASAPEAKPTSGSGALAGFTIGEQAPAPKAAAPAAAPAPTALKGFNVAPLDVFGGAPKPADTSGAFSKFLSFNKMPPAPKATYSGISGSTAATTEDSYKNHDDDISGIIANTTKGLPDAAVKVSKAINDTIIGKPAELLGRTKFIQEAAEGIDAGSVSGNFAQNMLGKLALGLNTVTGLTGGAYKAPIAPENPDLLDKGLTILSQGIGMAVGIGSLGRVIGATKAAGGAVEGLTNLANKYPLTAKYLAPYIAPLVENAAGFAAYGQLDPELGGDLAARGKRLLLDIGTAPLYTALGAIKSPVLSLPVSFGLGFGMAKLSGASNEDAVASGAAFAFLDAAGRAGGTRGFTADEIIEKLHSEARKTLQPYSSTKLTANSSAEDIKAAYYKAVHQTHPDVGGTAEKFNGVKSAYDLLTKGAVSKAPNQPTPAEQSTKLLRGEIKDAVATHGEVAAHQAIVDHLGVDYSTADKLLTAAKTPQTPAEIKAANEKVLAALPAPAIPSTKEEAAQRYFDAKIAPTARAGGATIIGADDLKDHFGQDYNISRHHIYSGAANDLYHQALKTNPDPTVKLTAGGTGSGKSDFLVSHAADNFKGVIYDSTGWNYEGMKKQIEAARAAGKTPIIYGIVPDLERARAYTFHRELKGEHPVTEKAFNRTHAGAIDTLIKLVKDGEDVRVLDTRGTFTKEDIKNLAFNHEPLDLLSQVHYTESDVKEKVSHVTKENAREIIARGPKRTGNVPAKNRAAESKQGKVAARIAELTKKLGGNMGATERAQIEKHIASLQIEAIHEIYASKPNAEDELHNMLAELLDLSVAGFRIIGDNTHNGTETIGVPSTFPKWIPEELRSMDLFRTVFDGVEKIADLKYPDNPKAYRQRELMDHVLAALDFRLGVDTFTERTAILQTYGEESAGGQASASQQEEVSTADDSSVERSQEAVLEALPPEIEAQAQTDWQDNYAEEFGDIFAQLSDAEKALKDAKAAERPALQDKVDALSEKLGGMENEFLAKWRDLAPEPASKSITMEFSGSGASKKISIEPGDMVRAINKETKQIVRREVRSVYADSLALVDPVSGIPFKYPHSKWSFDLVKKAASAKPLKYKVGDTFVDKHDGEVMTVTKVMPEQGKYTIESATGADATGTEKQILEHNTPVAQRQNFKKGMIAPGKMAEEVAAGVRQLKEVIEHHQEVGEIVGEISNAIYKEEGANKVLKVHLTRLVTEARTLSTPKEREHVYHYMEDRSYKLTDNERERVLPLIQAMDKTLEDLRAKAREAGITITGDIAEEHTPRNAVEKGGVIDKALDAYKEGKRLLSNGPKLTTSVGSGAKHRVYHILTDEAGKRTVVAIKDGKVTAIRGGAATELGTTEQVRQPKVKEFFDESVTTKLNKLAEDLGVTHERHATGKTQGLGGNRAGVSFGGADLIKTRLGPTSVLAHELGHQIDDKYGMQAVMRDDKYGSEHKAEVIKEMRALADKRFDGREVTESFKKYVRKGSEQMAVMFEAYIANREMFKEVAPHLYDDFRDFLGSHAELKPFLDIQPSVSLGSEKHGGGLVSGISGKEFVDKAGNSYIVGQATTLEIEANTNTRYYKDPLANYAIAIERTARAVRAKELLDKIKQSDKYKDAVIKVGERDVPAGFKTTRLDQMRGYYMEPHLAEAFDDLAKRSQGGTYFPIYDEVNNLLISFLVINPIMHYPNVAMGWGAATAAAGVVPEVDFMHTLKQVMNKDPEYLTWIEHGAPMQYLRQTNAEFADAMLVDLVADIKKEPTRYEEISQQLGYLNPIEWAHGLEKISSDSTWVANDIMLFNALKTYQKHYGVTYEKAIEEVSKRMADYRVPPRILGSRALSLAFQNNAAFMFMRFHYSGVIKPWIQSAYDSATGDKRQRYEGLRTLAYFAAMWFIYQLADKGLQKLSGNPNTYLSMAGPMKIPQNIQKTVETGSPVALLGGIFSFTPSIRIAGSILTGYDFSNFFKPVYGPGGEGAWAALKNQAAPYNAIEGAFTGVNSWTDFTLAQGGIYSPKSNVKQGVLNGMLNLEKPQIETQMKKLIADGDSEGALKLAHEFNLRLKDAIRTADVANGNSGSDARVDYFFQTFPNGLNQKGYAIRMPSDKSIANYEQRQGMTPGQRTLPGPGNVTSPKGKPSDINNHSDPGTIKAVVHGTTLYNRMTNAGAVKAQLSGGTVQPGTQLDHVVPLEGGGGNEADNLMILPEAMDNVNQAVEDFTGREVRAGRMSAAQAREVNIRFKAGLGEPLPQLLMNEYINKYKSQPMTLQQVNDYATLTGK